MPEEKEIDKDPIVRFFRSLGYHVDWDYDSSYTWYEIYDEFDYMVAQIQMGVSLEALREDMGAWGRGEDGTTFEEFWVAAEDNEHFMELCKKV